MKTPLVLLTVAAAVALTACRSPQPPRMATPPVPSTGPQTNAVALALPDPVNKARPFAITVMPAEGHEILGVGLIIRREKPSSPRAAFEVFFEQPPPRTTRPASMIDVGPPQPPKKRPAPSIRLGAVEPLKRKF